MDLEASIKSMYLIVSSLDTDFIQKTGTAPNNGRRSALCYLPSAGELSRTPIRPCRPTGETIILSPGIAMVKQRLGRKDSYSAFMAKQTSLTRSYEHII